MRDAGPIGGLSGSGVIQQILAQIAERHHALDFAERHAELEHRAGFLNAARPDQQIPQVGPGRGEVVRTGTQGGFECGVERCAPLPARDGGGGRVVAAGRGALGGFHRRVSLAQLAQGEGQGERSECVARRFRGPVGTDLTREIAELVQDHPEVEPRVAFVTLECQLVCRHGLQPAFLLRQSVPEVEGTDGRAGVGARAEAHLRLGQPARFGQVAPEFHEVVDVQPRGDTEPLLQGLIGRGFSTHEGPLFRQTSASARSFLRAAGDRFRASVAGHDTAESTAGPVPSARPAEHRRQPPPNSRLKNPPVRGSSACPAHCWDFGTPRITWSTCCPHPAQVVLPHLRHVTCLHIADLQDGVSVCHEPSPNIP